MAELQHGGPAEALSGGFEHCQTQLTTAPSSQPTIQEKSTEMCHSSSARMISTLRCAAQRTSLPLCKCHCKTGDRHYTIAKMVRLPEVRTYEQPFEQNFATYLTSTLVPFARCLHCEMLTETSHEVTGAAHRPVSRLWGICKRQNVWMLRSLIITLPRARTQQLLCSHRSEGLPLCTASFRPCIELHQRLITCGRQNPA